MARTQQQDANTSQGTPHQTGEVVMRGAILAISCAISYWLITHILANTYSISRDDNLLGGMWAVVATIFVYRDSNAKSVRSALSRMAAILQHRTIPIDTAGTYGCRGILRVFEFW